MWKQVVFLLLLGLFLFVNAKDESIDVIIGVNDYDRSPGKPMGMMPYCPGFNMSASVTDEYLHKHFSVIVQSGWKKRNIYRKRYFYKSAAEQIARDRNVDFKTRKTMIVLVESPLTTNQDAAYQISRIFSRIGFNAISVTTKPFTHERYAVTARMAKVVGNITALLIRDLMERGLDPADLVLVGGSLGAHMAGFVGKHFTSLTGKKIGHLIAIEPVGLCFRYAEPQDRLAPSDADFVQVLHANMYGYGMEQPVGHVDFYLNGGVYQSSWFAPLPCLSVCSHVKVFELFYYAMKYPGKFRGARCTSVAQAISAECFNNTPDVSNTMGLVIDKNITGVFYVSTTHLKPYYIPDYKRDLTAEFLRKVNPNGTMIIDEKTAFGYDYSTDLPRDLYHGYDKVKSYEYTTEDPMKLRSMDLANLFDIKSE